MHGDACKTMKHLELLDTLILHTTMAFAWAIGICCVGEKIAPGSVLTHVPFFWFIIPLIIGSLWVSRIPSSRVRFSVVTHFIPASLLLLGYFWTQIYGGGLPVYLLFGAIVLVGVVLLGSLLVAPHQESLLDS